MLRMPQGAPPSGPLRACRIEWWGFSEAGEVIQALYSSIIHFSPALRRIERWLMSAGERVLMSAARAGTGITDRIWGLGGRDLQLGLRMVRG